MKGGVIRRGMAGIIVVVLVLGFMMAVATSNSILIQSEMIGIKARCNMKQAYFAALAGVHFAVLRLRVDAQSNTFSADAATRLFFPNTTLDNADNHYRKWDNTTLVDLQDLNCTGGISSDTYYSTTTFPTNIEVDPTESKFILVSYPGGTTTTDKETQYWIKSQGIYTDVASGREYKAQVWAYVEINNTQKIVTLKKFGPMAVQSLTINNTPSTVVNDFWDWEKF